MFLHFAEYSSEPDVVERQMYMYINDLILYDNGYDLPEDAVKKFIRSDFPKYIFRNKRFIVM